MNKIYTVIPCAGSGSRAGGDKAKQYQKILGSPMILHTLKAILELKTIEHCLLVVAPHDQEIHDILLEHPLDSKSAARLTVEKIGGDTRAQSVLAGLGALLRCGASPQDWVLVHDAARCLVQAQWIEQLIEACQGDDVGGILAWPLSDTLKVGRDQRIDATLERADKWLAQTPQMFKLGPLMQALSTSSDLITDEASAMEAKGLRPKLVKASALNIKVTYPEDFLLAQAVLASQAQSLKPNPSPPSKSKP